MAGTLTVQTLQGPSSGANANKVIIPSGHTLDASNGTLVSSAGYSVQQVHDTTGAYQVIQSTSLVDTNLNCSITAKYDNSLYRVDIVASLWINNNLSGQNSVVYDVHENSTGSYTAIAPISLLTFHHSNNQDASHRPIVCFFDSTVAAGTTFNCKLRMGQMSSYNTGEIILNWPGTGSGIIPSGGTKSYIIITEIAQ